MKRFFAIASVLFACAALFAFDAEVVGVTGKAQVSTNGTTWTPLAVGNKVSQGATIQTGFNSQVKLKVKGSEVTLDAMTRIKVDQLSEKGDLDNTVVTMKIGSLTSNVKKLEDRRAGFTVRGPAATASVRGTVLTQECGYNKDTVTAIESTTMVWPTEEEAEEEEAVEGAEEAAAPSLPVAEDGRVQAKPGARAITPGQVSSVNNEGGQKSPQSHAAESALSIGGAPPSAAAMEGVAPAGAPTVAGPMGPAPSAGGEQTVVTETATTGGIVITVGYN